jgi:Tol biopolymer transport system component
MGDFMIRRSVLAAAIIASLCSCQSQTVATAPVQPTAQAVPKNIIDEPNQLLTNTRQQTFTGPRAGEGYFSRDGSHMIFQSEREPGNPFYQMYVMDLKSGHTKRVSPGKGKTTCGWIHPGMKKVMWSSTHLDPDLKRKTEEEYAQRKQPVKSRYSWSYDENFDIFESDLSGKNVHRLTKEKGYDAEGSYSPDGRWIAFASNRAGYTEKLSSDDEQMFKKDPSYMMDIYIMKSDGSDVKRLTTSKGYDGGPFFSPDGKKIIWRRFAPSGATAEVYTMNVDGSDQKQVTHLNAMSWAPYYHPSQDYFIFATSLLGFSNFELFIADSEGRQPPVRVTFTDGFDGLAVFSPDGHQLSWTHKNEKGESQIYVADWDDALARKLLKLPPQKLDPSRFNPEIKKENIKDIIGYLSSDEMAGRKAGSPEEKIYSQEIVKLFKAWGLQGGGPKGEFLQPFTFTSGVSLGANNTLEFMGNMKASLKVSEDFEPLSTSENGVYKEAPIVFAGYGIKAPASENQPAYDSYKGLDVKGKWVLILRDIPEDVSPELKRRLNLYGRLQHKITVARNEGAVGVLLAYGPLSAFKDQWGPLKYDGSMAESSVPALRIKNNWAEKMVEQSGKNLSTLQAQLNKGEMPDGFAITSVYAKGQVDLKYAKSEALNILAKIPSGGSKAVMIGAHGDHLGHGESGSSLAKGEEKGQVHNGADDNASGVAGVIELAHFYADYNARHPHTLKKDLYFAIWSAEEIGILGSTYFTRHWNEISNKPIKNYFSAYLNMDMIGRMKDRIFVQGVGSGEGWPQMTEEIAVKTGLPLSIQSDPYLPTDSMAFYLAEVPGINFFTGVHSEYHSPRDVFGLINFEGEEKVLRAVNEYTQTLVTSDADLVHYVKVSGQGGGHTGESRSFRIFLGTIPDYGQEGIKGVRISGVSKESPAEKAGLKEKDIIVELSGSKIENIYDYVYALQVAKPDKETIIKVRRGEAVLDLKIIPKLKE